jgi:hypothetical protein
LPAACICACRCTVHAIISATPASSGLRRVTSKCGAESDSPYLL